VPDNGIGYGMLRYLNPDTRPELTVAEPPLAFNYLGRMAAMGTGGFSLAPEAGALGDGHTDPSLPMSHALAVNSVVLNGELAAQWTWPAALFDEQQVRELAELWFEALAGLTAHAQRPGSGGRTPSDLPLLSLDQAQIERIEAAWGHAE
jgi:non-ribosomal peptide synthase protein (TIGR01720 family)